MRKMRLAALICLLTLFALAANAEDAFTTEQQKAASDNPVGVALTLRLPVGKTEFRQGEIIPLILAFSSLQPSCRLNRFLLEEAHLDTVHVSPADNVADPLAEIRRRGYGFSGYVPPPLPLTTNSTSLTITLNEQMRFDRPGLYRLYVTSRRILDDKATTGESAEGGQAATSNIVEITVVPPEDAWAHTQIQKALAILSRSVHQTREHRAALRTLRFLGTQESVCALLGRLSTDELPGESPSDAEDCRRGLIGYPDRRWLVAEMKGDMSQPDYAVSQTFLETLVLLDSTPGEAASARTERFRAAWLATADAVALKTGRVRAMTLSMLVSRAWFDADLSRIPAVQSLVPDLTPQLATAFGDLPSLPQQYLLDDYDWPRFRSPALLPALRRLWAATKPSEDGDYRLPDLTLRRIYDLSPTEGRALALQEKQSAEPRVSKETLILLLTRD